MYPPTVSASPLLNSSQVFSCLLLSCLVLSRLLFRTTDIDSLLLLTLITGADINSSYTLGHSLSCFLVMVWSRKFAGTRVRAWRLTGLGLA